MNNLKKIKQALGNYTSNDEKDFQNIINNLKKALKETPDALVDYVDGVEMWEKVEMEFTVKNICELIGLELE